MKRWVLLHGLNENQSMFSHWTHLRKNHEIFAPNIPPFGIETPFLENYKMETYAEWLHNYLPKDGTFYIAGHSMGGYIALAFAEKYPNRIEAIALINSTPEADSPERILNRNRTISLLQRKPSTYFDGFFSVLFENAPAMRMENRSKQLECIAKQTPPHEIIKVIEGLRDRKDRTLTLQSPSYSAHLIGGDRDSLISKANLEKIAISVNANLHILPKIGHMAPWEAESDVENILLSISSTVI
jgi:pimeloyl-ACP methyl ester carboxylesterase